MSIPLATEASVGELRTALRSNADTACEAVMAGERLDFAKEPLDSELQKGSLRYMERSCDGRAARAVKGMAEEGTSPPQAKRVLLRLCC